MVRVGRVGINHVRPILTLTQTLTLTLTLTLTPSPAQLAAQHTQSARAVVQHARLQGGGSRARARAVLDVRPARRGAGAH